jgi:hypothetical protein
MNYHTNGFATLKAYLRFYRFSAMYLEIDPVTTQEISYELISKRK